MTRKQYAEMVRLAERKCTAALIDCQSRELPLSLAHQGLASNPRLERQAGRLLGEAYGLSKYSGRTEHVYG